VILNDTDGRFKQFLTAGDITKASSLYKDNWTLAQLSVLLNCSQSTIWRNLSKLKILRQCQINIPFDELIKYETEGKSLKDLALMLNCDKSVIKRNLIKYGINIRNHEDAMLLAGKQKKTARANEFHSNWRGGMITLPYSPLIRSAHHWIHFNYGSANKCEFNVNHNSKRYHWANISGKYQKVRTDWLMLCPSCHYWFDHPCIQSLLLDKLDQDCTFAYQEGRRLNNAKAYSCL